MSSEIDELEVRSQIRVGERPGALQVEALGIFEARTDAVLQQHVEGPFRLLLSLPVGEKQRSERTEYLAALPADRREALNEVRRGINRALPQGYKEGSHFGMISWFVPLSTYPAGYGGNPKEPLLLISVASQKSLAR